jgi:glycosyltransferase involved in cell wall biosynthesis
MKICHVGTMGELKNYGSITRDIASRCKGEHIHADLYSSRFPKADIYLLHCFRNYKHLKAFRDFVKPFPDSKVISLIHSSEPCMPALCSDSVVTLSKCWHDRMLNKFNIKSDMIRGAIDVSLYADVQPDYSGLTFGRISRNEKGKFHKDWPIIAQNVTVALKAKYLLMCKDISPNDTGVAEEQIINCNINNMKAKKEFLSRLSVYADMHDDRGLCEETFGVALLEAMACGLPCIVYNWANDGLLEVGGDAVVPIAKAEDFEKYLKILLTSEKVKIERGAAARERAKQFDINVMIAEWDTLFERSI